MPSVLEIKSYGTKITMNDYNPIYAERMAFAIVDIQALYGLGIARPAYFRQL